MEKFLIVKVGGEDCCKRKCESSLKARYCLINYADCPNPTNCPHGKTKEELVAIAANKIAFQHIDPEGVAEPVISALLEEK